MTRDNVRNRSGSWAFFGILVLLGATVGCGGGDETLPEGPDAQADTEAALREILEQLKAPEPEKVVATVNGEEIRAGKVYDVAALNLISLESQGQTLTEQEERELRMRTLELIINDELMAQEAARRGHDVSPERLEQELQTIRDQHGTAAAFQKVLDDAGLTEDQFREELGRRLLSQELVAEITKDVTVDEAEAKSFYDRFPEQFSEGETVEVSQILIRSVAGEPEARREAARGRAEQARDRAVAGEDFAALAKEYSQAPNAAKGGLVPHFPRGVMVPQFEEVAFGLEVGEISDVFETPYGFNVIRLEDRKEAEIVPFAEVKPKLMVDLSKLKETALVQQTLTRLQQESDVRVLDPEFLPKDDEQVESAPEAPDAEGQGT